MCCLRKLIKLTFAVGFMLGFMNYTAASDEISKKYLILTCEVEKGGTTVVLAANTHVGIPPIVTAGENCADALASLDQAGFELINTNTSEEVLIHTLTALAICGDSVLEGSEVCDVSELGGNTCVSLGFASGSLTCGDACTSFDTSACVSSPNLPNGSACTLGEQCQSSFCVDGFCSDSACAGACDSASIPGSEGVCTVNPTGSSGNPSCSPFACTGVSSDCPASCTTDANCVSGAFCSGIACVPKKPNGNACAGNNECLSGSCVGGICQ